MTIDRVPHIKRLFDNFAFVYNLLHPLDHPPALLHSESTCCRAVANGASTNSTKAARALRLLIFSRWLLLELQQLLLLLLGLLLLLRLLQQLLLLMWRLLLTVPATKTDKVEA